MAYAEFDKFARDFGKPSPYRRLSAALVLALITGSFTLPFFAGCF